MSWRLILAACLALSLVFAVRWYLPSQRAPATLPELPDVRFDYSLSNFSARFSDADGEVELLVSGPRLDHDSATRVATLIEPRFHFEPSGGNWRGRANQGRFDRDAEDLILEGNVVLTQPQESGELAVTGETLQHNRLARTISSDQPVEIKRPGTWMRTGGLMIRLDTDIIELSNHVQAKIQVDRSDPNRSDGRSDSDRREPGR